MRRCGEKRGREIPSTRQTRVRHDGQGSRSVASRDLAWIKPVGSWHVVPSFPDGKDGQPRAGRTALPGPLQAPHTSGTAAAQAAQAGAIGAAVDTGGAGIGLLVGISSSLCGTFVGAGWLVESLATYTRTGSQAWFSGRHKVCWQHGTWLNPAGLCLGHYGRATDGKEGDGWKARHYSPCATEERFMLGWPMSLPEASTG